MIQYVKRGFWITAVMLAFLSVMAARMNFNYVDVFQSLNDKMETIVVLDSGHGGFDPGKIGITGAVEKDLNLAIALKVKRNLEHQGITVVMTRDGDYGLYNENSSSKKKEDMRARVNLINQSGAVLAVSIHQNSFTNSSYDGAQVFYYTGSAQGEQLAKSIQQSFITYVDPENHREAKANSDYYLLKNSAIPAVIAECGFLSNPDEEALLMTDEYQEKVAWAIYMGILNYMKEIH